MNGPPAGNDRRFSRRFLVTAGLLLAIDCTKQIGLMAAGPVQPWPDSALYWQLGRDAAAGDVWLMRSAVAIRTPLYPWFLGACQLAGGARALWLAVICQHVLEMAISVLTAATVYEITRSPRAALWAYGACVLLTARCL